MSKIDPILGVKNESVRFSSLFYFSTVVVVIALVIDSRPGRACVALAWNPKLPNLVRSLEILLPLICCCLKLLSGFDKSRSDHCLTIWDITHNPLSSSSPIQSLTSMTMGTGTDEYKRLDNLWRPSFDCGLNEQCHSLTWFKPNERLFAASTSQHTTRTIRIYDPRGLVFLFSPICESNEHSLASSPVALSFPSKAPFNLCADSSERYLAASIDVNKSDWN